MKGLLLPLLLLLLSGCKYSSEREARSACGKWEDKGGQIKETYTNYKIVGDSYIDIDGKRRFEYDVKDFGGEILVDKRYCYREKSTRQILGIEQEKLKKRFKY